MVLVFTKSDVQKIVYIGLLLSSIAGLNMAAQPSLSYKGQLSAWTLYNGGLDLPVYMGGRYIPQLNYEVNLKNTQKIDFEASLNMNGNFGFYPFDTISHYGTLKPYRLWARYSGEQFELRVGLQKINFGSANMIRPLMWFDSVDPRDPLNLTDGVWGILGRYYFLNNANLWLWMLYGNDTPRGWDLAKSYWKIPEFGGRFQSPVPGGEAGISYHHRVSDTRDVPVLPTFDQAPENRLGVDLRFDLFVGAWLEGAWINNSENLGIYTNQELLNLGLDYTFGLGNGLYVIFEQLLASYDEKPFELENTRNFSLLSLSYPIGLFSNVSGIIYYDWTNNNIYNFLNINHSLKHLTLYLMAFWNPEDYFIPGQDITTNLYGGKGIQFMIVLNH